MEQVPVDTKKRGVQCVSCEYRWNTRTNLLYISCPNCRHTNKTADAVNAFNAADDKTEEAPTSVTSCGGESVGG